MLSTCLSCINASLLLSIGIEKSIVSTVSKVKYSLLYWTENTRYRPPLTHKPSTVTLAAHARRGLITQYMFHKVQLNNRNTMLGVYLHQIVALGCKCLSLSAERVHIIWQPQMSSSRPVKFPQSVCKQYRKLEMQYWVLLIFRRYRILQHPLPAYNIRIQNDVDFAFHFYLILI